MTFTFVVVTTNHLGASEWSSLDKCARVGPTSISLRRAGRTTHVMIGLGACSMINNLGQAGEAFSSSAMSGPEI
ncbi:MAG: hypothetical protein U0236_08250 [Nitrospira sp.]